jgi:hypothetical protein
MARKSAKTQSWTSEQISQLTKFVNDHLPRRTISEALASLGIGRKTAKKRSTAKATARRRTGKAAGKGASKRAAARRKTTKAAKRA